MSRNRNRNKRKRRQPHEDVICPECGKRMVLRETHRFLRNGNPRKFYGCLGYPKCRATHGAHQDGRPLGIPANEETKLARVQAHAVFDRLWKTGTMSRKQAYVHMRELMGLSKDNAHIGKFTKEQCDRLIELLAAENAEMVRGLE